MSFSCDIFIALYVFFAKWVIVNLLQKKMEFSTEIPVKTGNKCTQIPKNVFYDRRKEPGNLRGSFPFYHGASKH